MWSCSRVVSASFGNLLHRRISAAIFGLLALSTLGACGFSPLYGNSSAGPKLVLAYADPTSRTEQIIYQQLALRLGQTDSVNAPLVSLTATPASRTIGRSTTDLSTTTSEVTVTAIVKVTQNSDNGFDGVETLYQVTKAASATYTSNGQSLADRQALSEATSRAALAVGNTLSLLIRAKLKQ